MTIKHNLTLEYQLQTGWLEPFVQGLQQGVAMGRACTACKKTTFPPIRTCECGQADGEWVALSGLARIVHRCDGTEGSFALVQFEGANTESVVCLENMDASVSIGYLKASGTDKPAMVIAPMEKAS